MSWVFLFLIEMPENSLIFLDPTGRCIVPHIGRFYYVEIEDTKNILEKWMINVLYFKRKMKVFFSEGRVGEKIRRHRDMKLESVTWPAKLEMQLKQSHYCVFKASG